ncbi:MAG: tetratricopeptide repeat protein [Syntrophotaleaceae bacterium]
MLRNCLLILAVLWLSGCSVPRIIVLNDPLDARQHNDLGVSYEAQGEYDLALREYRRAAELDELWARPLINGGNALAAQEQWSAAAELYRQALERQPGQAGAMNNLAWVLLQQGSLEQARHWAELAVAASPQTAAFQDTLGAVKERQGQENGAQ